jgi:ribose 5-phosphate isomerase B
MNVLVMGSRVVGEKLAEDIVRAYLPAKFTNEERHVRRLAKVRAIEEEAARLEMARTGPED